MFEQVSIIGCGLIGSSVFRALKKSKSVKKVITFELFSGFYRDFQKR